MAERRNWTIRRANDADADALADCLDAAYADHAARLVDLPPMSSGIAEEIAKNQVWVADVAGAVVGGLILVPDDGFLTLANVAVHPTHRGAGLGRAFLALAENEALRHGCRELRLTTHVEIPENAALYRHLGWQEIRRSGNKVFMRKTV